jgi:voltage-gated potassium channel
LKNSSDVAGEDLSPETLSRGTSAGQTMPVDARGQPVGGPSTPTTNAPAKSRRSVWLLVLLLVFLVLNPLLEKDQLGEAILLFSMYATLISATQTLSERTRVRWPAIVLAGFSILVMAAAHLYPLRLLSIINWSILAAFFAVVSIGFFAYLGRSGAVTDDRIFVSVSLYLLLAMLWFSLYNLLEATHPGSFFQASAPTSELPRGTMIYLSLATLTTLGYGDIVPVTPIARMVAALEAVAGVLYIAITVARLVAGYRSSNQEAG